MWRQQLKRKPPKKREIPEEVKNTLARIDDTLDELNKNEDELVTILNELYNRQPSKQDIKELKKNYTSYLSCEKKLNGVLNR